MAQYHVRAPDGALVILNGPDGASQEEVIAQAQTLYQPTASAAPAPVSVAPSPFIGPEEDRAAIMAARTNPPQPSAGLGEIFTKAIENTPVSTAGSLAGVARGVIETGDYANLKARTEKGIAEGTPPGLLDTAGFVLNAGPSLAARTLFDDPVGALATVQNEAGAQMQENGPYINPNDTFKQIVNSAAQSLPQQIPGMIGAIVTKNPELALVPGMAISGGQEYGDQRDAGRDPYQAVPAAGANALAERIGEKLPLGELLEKPAKAGVSGAVKKVGRVAASDAVGEGVTQAMQDAVDKATIKPDMTLAEALHNQEVAMGAGALTGGTIGTPVAALEARKASKNPQAPKVNPEVTPPASPPAQADLTPADVPAEQPKAGAIPAAPQPTAAAPAARPVEPQMTSVNPFEKPAEKPPVAESTPPAKPVAQSETPAQLPQQPAAKKIVTPDGSMEIDANDEVIDASELKPAGEDLQPRDRTKATSDLQIQKIANELDPERLGDSRTTDQGAPIVGPDNIVESGNGRVAAIKQAYAANGPAAARYRAKLKAAGHNIDNIKEPVLVRRRSTALSPEERVRFTSLSNKPAIAEMSSTEKAKADAAQIDDSLIDMHKGGEPDSADNADFMRGFVNKVVTPNEAGSLIGTDKRPTQEGVKRAKAALVAKAYDNPDLVENIFDNADPEVKGIGNVLRDRAPEFAQLGAAVRRGDVPARFDITKQLMEAVKIIRDAKRDKKNIRDVIEGTKQTSLIDEEKRDPLVEKLVRSMYRPGLGRMLPQSTIDKVLSQYATSAREQKSEDLFGKNTTNAADLIDAAYQKHTVELETKANGQGAFLDAEGSAPQAENIPAAERQDAAPADAAPKQESVPSKDNVESDQGEGESDGVVLSRKGKQRTTTPTDPDEAAKTGGKKFEDFSKTQGTSKYRTAYVDMGLDPNIATSMPADKQLDLLAGAMRDRFGMKIEIAKDLDRRAALDMLHNMYNNLSFISAVFKLPYKAIGLNGTLALKLQKNLRGALGAYAPATQTIILPAKSNSFIHEWLHALDHHIMNQLSPSAQGDLFSGVVRKGGVVDPHDGVQAAFANVLNHLFYDKAALAAIALDLEAKLSRAKTDGARAEIERKLKELKAGNYHGINGKTNYYKGSHTIGKASYWTSPEEMLARAFEAYSAYKIDQAGGDSSSIAKGDTAYLSNVDDRLAKTFPKLAERQAIFDALDELMARISENSILGHDTDRTAPMRLSDFSIMDSADWAYMPEKSPYAGKGIAARVATFKKRLIDEQVREIERWRHQVTKMKEAIIERKKINKENPKSANSALNWLRGMIFSSDRSVMHALETKYTSPALKALNDRVFTRPGQGEVVKQDFFFTTRNVTTQYKKRLGNLMKTFAAEHRNEKENLQIRNILIGKSDAGSARVKNIAGNLRKLLDDMYQEMKNAGVDVGYLRNQGYLSRLYITRKILSDKPTFLKKAAEVYGLQFDQNIGSIIDDIIEDPTLFTGYLKMMLRKSPDKLSINKKQAAELIGALQSGNLTDELKQRLQDILPDVRSFYSETAAMDWLHRIQFGPQDELENGSPSSGFTKKRALPPEADTILEDFLETDPFAVVDHYADLVGRRVGLQKAMNPVGKPTYLQLLKQMTDEGVSPQDAKIIKAKFDKIFGIDDSDNTHTGAIKNILSVAHLGGMLSLLDLSAIASLPERFTGVIKTKRVADLFNTIIYSMDQLAGTQDAREAREAAEAIGIITNEGATAALDARMGGFKEIDLVQKISAQFFIRNGLAALDNSNRLVNFRISKGYFEHLARTLLNDKKDAITKDLVTRELAEYGIAPEDAVAFSKWLVDPSKGGFQGFGDVRALRESPFGMDFILALNRFNDQTIQRPTAADRPYASKNPIGSLVFAVTSFSFAFYENVVKSEAKKIAYVGKNYGAMEAAKRTALLTASWAPLMAATIITNALRVALFDKDKWEEMKGKDELEKYLFLRSLSSVGILGPVVDFMVNLTTGVRYQRDAATSISGAYISQYLKWLESLIAASNVSVALGKDATNSPNTNTQEYNLIKNTWKTIIAPSIAAGLSVLPGGKLMSTMSGLGIAGIGSSTLADTVATDIVGPKGGKKNESKSGDKEPKEPREPREP